MTTMTAFNTRTVGELAVEMPASIRIFEAWKIDYCCGGQTQLTEACAAAGKSVDEFIGQLERAAVVHDDAQHGWANQTLQSMASRIVAVYHAYTREELATLATLASRVVSVHGERRPELAQVVTLIRELTGDMLPHMLKEEQLLFPYVGQLEEATEANLAPPTPFFGTVKNPVRMMMLEHDRVAELLENLRKVSSDYAPPESACFSYRELYRRLAEFEQRTHEHVHVENNIYFPRAIALEEQAGSANSVEFTGGACGASCSH